MTTSDVPADPIEDEDIIELTEEIEAEDDEIIDLTDGIDPTVPEHAVETFSTPEPLMSDESLSFGPPKPVEETESGKDLLIEELTIDSLEEEIPALDIDHQPAQTSTAVAEMDIDLDLDRLLPEVSPTDALQMAPPPEREPKLDEHPEISLDSLLAEETPATSADPLLDIGLPLPESLSDSVVPVDQDSLQSETDLQHPEETFSSTPLTDRISDEQIDRALERVIRGMFEERISAAIHEVVGRIVQDEMDRLRRLLLEEP